MVSCGGCNDDKLGVRKESKKRKPVVDYINNTLDSLMVFKQQALKMVRQIPSVISGRYIWLSHELGPGNCLMIVPSWQHEQQ